MSKKKTNKLLIYILLILLAAVVVNQIIKSKKGERTFKSELLSFSADDVKSLSIFTKENKFEEMKLIRNGDDWRISFAEQEYSADGDMASNMANDLGKLKADRLVANNKDKWTDFDVTDTTGVRVIVNGDKDVLCDVFIGRFAYDQNSRKASTYVRLNGEKDVYSVEGYLSMLFNRDVNGFRNKSLFRGNQNDLTKLSFQFPGDSAFTLSKVEDKWMIGDMPADSVKTATFLTGISYLVGTDFVDAFDINAPDFHNYSVSLDGENMSTVVLTGYRNESGNSVLTSSQNPGSMIDASNGDLFEKVFLGPGYFMGIQE